MRAVIQRVKGASVNILPDNYEKGRIGAGLLVLVAVEDSDTAEDIRWLASKICGLRIFEDGDGKMNLSVLDVGGEILTVSQFTLYGNVRKGFRPSFNRSARAEIAVPVYENFVNKMSLVDNSILTKISEITYVPNEVDQERFTFKMNDGNLVYITLSKITKINRYNSIYSEMEGKNGIIYLDSGDYIELK